MKLALLLVSFAFVFGLLFKILPKKRKRKKSYVAILKSRRFLFFKGQEQKYLNDFSARVNNNLPRLFGGKVNYKILESAGLFSGREMLKFSVLKFDRSMQKEIFAINKFNKDNKFTVLIFAKREIKTAIEQFAKRYSLCNIKLIDTESINPKLVFEINKLNINYSPNEEVLQEGIFFDGRQIEKYKLKQTRLESKNFINNSKINCYKILEIPRNENIFNFKSFNAVEIIDCKNIEKIKYVKKLSSPFVTAYKNRNVIEIKYLKNNEKLYFSENNFDFLIKKSQKNAYLIVNFKKLNKKGNLNSVMCICSSDKVVIPKVELATFLLANHIAVCKFFDIEFMSTNLELNKFMQKKLPDIVCKHYLIPQVNKVEICDLPANFDFLSRKKYHNVNIVRQLLSEILGVKLLEDKLQLSPKDFVGNFQFRINFGLSLLIQFKKTKGKKLVKIDDLDFVNLNYVNIKSIKGNQITFCG